MIRDPIGLKLREYVNHVYRALELVPAIASLRVEHVLQLVKLTRQKQGDFRNTLKGKDFSY